MFLYLPLNIQHPSINDVYDADIKDDQLVLLYETNRISQVSIKTPVGQTDRKDIEEVNKLIQHFDALITWF